MSEDKNIIKYQVAGEEVKLSPSIVNQFLKRGNSNITNAEAINFIQLCKYQKLNPFLNEAYLVKFGNEPAQMIVGKEAFMKKAEKDINYKGFKAGLILERDKKVVEVEGSFKLTTDKLLGAWCEVYLEGKENVIARVNFEEYNKGQSTWKKMPGTMIRKVAIVQALREAFPNSLGGMYVEEEMNKKTRVAEPEEKSKLEKELEESGDIEKVQEVEYEEVE